MSFKIEYQTFNIESIELSHIEYVSLKKKSRKGFLDLNNHLPNIRFYDAEKDRFQSFGISIGIGLAGLLLLVVLEEYIYGSLWVILVGAPAYLAFFGVGIIGLGLIFSFVSYLSFSARRRVKVSKIIKAFKESLDYEDYCRIRKIKYRPTDGGTVLNEILGS